MRHRVSSAATAAVFIIAMVGVGLWFHGGGTTPAYADFLQPILDAKTVRYKISIEMTGTPAGTTGLSAEEQEKRTKPHTSKIMELGFNRQRQESETPGKRVVIWDGNQRKQLILQPAEKRATLYEYSQEPEAKAAQKEDRGSASLRSPPEEPGSVALFRSLLLDTLHNPDVRHESLGEKVIDGRRVVGFRLSTRGVVMKVWGDPKTRLPVRIESTMALAPHLKVTASDFEFNVPMDASLFSVEPPAGYTLTVKQGQPSDDSPAGEKDLIEMFRYYGRWMGKRFPDVLDALWIDDVLSRARRLDADLPPRTLQEERERQLEEAGQKLRRAMMFAARLPKDSGSHYAGRGVSIGAVDTPVFWYRPKDATEYRVIYADLSVRETKTPPRMSVVPVAQLEKDLLAMFRQYAELMGDRFPDNLLFPKFVSRCLTAYPRDTVSAEQQQELLEARVKLQQGALFIGLLPKDADWHYAGKGVWHGAAGRPIFWYRPDGSETYRVVYADLSVRDAQTPPSMSDVPPEQDLLNALRYYSELFDGRFPISLDDPTLLGERYESFLWSALSKVYVKFPADVEYYPTATQRQELMKATKNIQPGVDFVASLPPQSDRHYAGWGASFGAADRPIFWYHLEGSTKYRVIYADLSVRDADAAPDMAAAPPLDELIDALRYYSEQSDGTFPDSLDRKGFFQALEKKLTAHAGQRTPAKQVDESAESELKLQPGAAFAASLPPEADAHYAGKGAFRGKADSPIFWYRPKDAKAYRVVYADLSVHDTDMPPNAAQAHPVRRPSSPKK